MSLKEISCIPLLSLMYFHIPGAVYLKNSIFRYWKERDPSEAVDEELPYCIPEAAKALIRENIIGAIIQAPVLIG